MKLCVFLWDGFHRSALHSPNLNKKKQENKQTNPQTKYIYIYLYVYITSDNEKSSSNFVIRIV